MPWYSWTRFHQSRLRFLLGVGIHRLLEPEHHLAPSREDQKLVPEHPRPGRVEGLRVAGAGGPSRTTQSASMLNRSNIMARPSVVRMCDSLRRSVGDASSGCICSNRPSARVREASSPSSIRWGRCWPGPERRHRGRCRCRRREGSCPASRKGRSGQSRRRSEGRSRRRSRGRGLRMSALLIGGVEVGIVDGRGVPGRTGRDSARHPGPRSGIAGFRWRVGHQSRALAVEVRLAGQGVEFVE